MKTLFFSVGNINKTHQNQKHQERNTYRQDGNDNRNPPIIPNIKTKPYAQLSPAAGIFLTINFRIGPTVKAACIDEFNDFSISVFLEAYYISTFSMPVYKGVGQTYPGCRPAWVRSRDMRARCGRGGLAPACRAARKYRDAACTRSSGCRRRSRRFYL